MSLLISKPYGTKIEKVVLENAFEKYKDGAGFCYSKNDQLIIRKIFKTFEGFYSSYLAIENNACLINFAEKDFPVGFKNFCGPFKIDENHALIHIGDFWETKFLANKEESQTANFIKFLKNIWRPDFFGKDYLKWIIEEAFSPNNLIVIFNNKGTVQIFNKIKGSTFGGVWYSDYPQKYNTNIFRNNISPPNRYDYQLPICSKCRFRCQGGSVSQNGVIYCNKCNEERSKIIQHSFKNDTKILLKPKINNDFLKEVLPDPNLIDLFDIV